MNARTKDNASPWIDQIHTYQTCFYLGTLASPLSYPRLRPTRPATSTHFLRGCILNPGLPANCASCGHEHEAFGMVLWATASSSVPLLDMAENPLVYGIPHPKQH